MLAAGTALGPDEILASLRAGERPATAPPRFWRYSDVRKLASHSVRQPTRGDNLSACPKLVAAATSAGTDPSPSP